MHHSRGGRCARRAPQETRARRALHADLGSLDPYRVAELATCPDGHLFDRPQLASMETRCGQLRVLPNSVPALLVGAEPTHHGHVIGGRPEFQERTGITVDQATECRFCLIQRGAKVTFRGHGPPPHLSIRRTWRHLQESKASARRRRASCRHCGSRDVAPSEVSAAWETIKILSLTDTTVLP